MSLPQKTNDHLSQLVDSNTSSFSSTLNGSEDRKIDIDKDILRTRVLSILQTFSQSTKPIVQIMLELEQDICEHFGVNNFSTLGHGSLVSFLASEESIVGDCLGSKQPGITFSQEEVLDFARQCMVHTIPSLILHC